MQIAFMDVLHAESTFLPKLGGFQDSILEGSGLVLVETNLQLHVHVW